MYVLPSRSEIVRPANPDQIRLSWLMEPSPVLVTHHIQTCTGLFVVAVTTLALFTSST